MTAIGCKSKGTSNVITKDLEKKHPEISMRQQCKLLDVVRSTVTCKPEEGRVEVAEVVGLGEGVAFARRVADEAEPWLDGRGNAWPAGEPAVGAGAQNGTRSTRETSRAMISRAIISRVKITTLSPRSRKSLEAYGGFHRPFLGCSASVWLASAL